MSLRDVRVTLTASMFANAGSSHTFRGLHACSNCVSHSGEMKHLPDDFRDFLSLLNEKGVDYLIVGGWALGVHGYVRATGDIDVWVGLSESNLDRLFEAMIAFGVPGPISKSFFREKGNAFRMGSPPIRIEVITEASGIEFEKCLENRVLIDADGLSIPFLGYPDLIANKRASGRLKDLADLEALGEPLEGDPPAS